MDPWMIWAAALVAYLLFRLWYDNWSGPLTSAEIDGFLGGMEDRTGGVGTSPEVLRAFLEADDGREFLMVNLVKVPVDPVTDPVSGRAVTGVELFKRYARRFVPLLLRHGGHPVFAGRKVGGYVDSWNVPADPGWTMFGVMRYRSRRDLIRLAMDPFFKDAHAVKMLGTLATFSFPAQPLFSLHPGPRVTAALVLALTAALAHLLWVLR